MCGIVGYLNKNNTPSDAGIIEKMTDSLAHRGPHDHGSYRWRNVAIGHRRLAIIDLEAGKQPMSNEDGTVWITYNGELYNYRELRKLLQDKGHLFKTHSDTEVIVHGYEEWGKNAVEYFRGMFAFAIVDIKKNEIFLARDHIGIKPLVYYNTRESFAFSSELQAFHAFPGFDPAINMVALDNYLQLHYIPPPITIYKDAYKLPPAHRMAVGFNGEIKYMESYWDINFDPDYSRKDVEWLEELDHILRESIEKHLIADVPVGAFLSGGIDSTVIVKYMTELMGEKVPKTFSIGFDEDRYSELSYSSIASKKYRTEHYTEIVSHHSVDILPKLVKHYGEPFGDDSCIPTYYLSRFASEQVAVVLSGDGGDEFFSGYIAYDRWLRLTQGEFPRFYENYPVWKKIMYPIFHHLTPSRYPAKYYVKFKNNISEWVNHVQTLDTEWRKKLWKSGYNANGNNIPQLFKELSGNIERLSAVQMAQYIDIKTALPSALLPKVDIASMMHGLEVRTPLTDKNVAEFAAKIPQNINLKKTGKKSYIGKYLLKRILDNDFNHEFIHRRKMGFTPPTLTWFSAIGNKRNFVEERLLSNDAAIAEFFNENAIRELFKQNKVKALWLFLVLEYWLQHVHNANKEKAV
jgi:asparagine synthase (glutamine-hydrolysing)